MVSELIRNKYKEYLLKNEKLIAFYMFGLYVVLVSDFRVIIKKRFPSSLFVFRYKDIEIVEYVKTINYKSLVMGLLSLLFGFAFLNFMGSAFIHVVDGEYLIFIFAVAAFTLTLVNAFNFASSLFGKIRIILKFDKKPIEMITEYSKDISEFIKHIENKK